ncbi:hypothetical protein CTI12_AA041670 [Artemisia annua]|uniref:Ataxin-2 C-terminal domain-containing protein n=1 Tax=Artemisia annua TaxID=35608 RepID=A0A2U1QE65_ARTAN|nr:hypothetical protein CTI12_AA041670 [Artemisia annua]
MPMDVMPRQQGLPSSALNPNAPMFVPLAYRNVEDFSDQWWSLVHYDTFFPDDDLIDVNGKNNGSQEREVRKDMMLVRLSNWRKACVVDAPRLYQKVRDCESESKTDSSAALDLVGK